MSNHFGKKEVTRCGISVARSSRIPELIGITHIINGDGQSNEPQMRFRARHNPWRDEVFWHGLGAKYANLGIRLKEVLGNCSRPIYNDTKHSFSFPLWRGSPVMNDSVLDRCLPILSVCRQIYDGPWWLEIWINQRFISAILSPIPPVA